MEVVFSPIRHGNHVTIRPVRPEDYGRLYDIALFTDAGSRWRLHGDVPTKEQFLQLLFSEARATFAVEGNEDRRVLGMVQLWDHQPVNRHGHITAFLDPAVQGRGWPLEGILLFVQYVFVVFDLHKLYFESLQSEFEQYGSLVGTILKQEGHLREHRWVFGRLMDCYILALYAADVPKLAHLLARPNSEWTAPIRAQSASVPSPEDPVVVDMDAET